MELQNKAGFGIGVEAMDAHKVLQVSVVVKYFL